MTAPATRTADTVARSAATPGALRRLTWPAWGWSLVGALIVWAVIMAVRPGAPFDPITQALTLTPFLVLVALGQMLVITLGPGNIDVSVGTIISMTSYEVISDKAAYHQQ